MAWFIQEDVNDGYPALNGWLESWQTSWTSDSSHRYPDYMWRIKTSVNDGYPWIYPWFMESSSDTGDLVIGGSQTNYPNGFSYANKGGIKDQFNDDDMRGGTGGSFANSVITSAMSERAFVINGQQLNSALAALNDQTVFDEDEANLISKLYGANVFDSFLSCKVFPFSVPALSYFGAYGWQSVMSSSTADIKAFGRYTLTTNANLLAGSFGVYKFPVIEVNPLQAWEIESIDYSLYLPMSGTYPVDIRGYSAVYIELYVDLINGTGEYYVYINNQIVMINRVMLGADVPINTNYGRMQGNMLTNVLSSLGKGATLIGGAVGGAVGGVGGAVLGGAIGTLANSITGNYTQHYSMCSPSVGGLASMACYPFPRVIAKIPKMFKDGYGYHETLGQNRSTAYIKLSECSGYIKCENYKTDIIVATDSEKNEIERLMNNGVFI